MKKITSYLLRVSIALALLIFLLARTDVHGLVRLFRHADVALLGITFGVMLFLNVMVSLRWQVLLRGLGIRVAFGRVFVSYLGSLFVNLVFPSTIGGDAARTLDITRYSQQRDSCGTLASVLLDRISGFFGLITVLAFSLFFGGRVFHDPNILIVSGLLLLAVAFCCGFMFWRRFFSIFVEPLPFKKLKAYLGRMHEASSSCLQKKRYLAAAWGLSFLTHIGISLTYYLTARAMGFHVDLIYCLILVPMVTAFSTLPLSIGGLGLRDAAAVFVFVRFGLLREQALSLSLANFGYSFLLGLLGGLCYVLTLRRRRV